MPKALEVLDLLIEQTNQRGGYPGVATISRVRDDVAELIAALQGFTAFAAQRRAELGELSPEMETVNARARAAIAKATGGAA